MIAVKGTSHKSIGILIYTLPFIYITIQPLSMWRDVINFRIFNTTVSSKIN